MAGTSVPEADAMMIIARRTRMDRAPRRTICAAAPLIGQPPRPDRPPHAAPSNKRGEGSKGREGLAEELVRVLLADEPTGEEPLAGILEYALQALVTNNVHPVLVPGQEVRWTSG